MVRIMKGEVSKMKKESYERMTMEVVVFEAEDIITTSPLGGDKGQYALPGVVGE